MSLSIGIVGLPNVGKSTLFNALTKKSVSAENFPFCTIDPSVGVIAVPDNRLKQLKEMSGSEKIIPAIVEFVDIAGLVKGASDGEGLGNKFLSNIREVDAILQVVRVFEDEDITHVHESVDPLRDVEVINMELVLADMQTVTKRIEGLAKDIKRGDKDALIESDAVAKVEKVLEAGNPARSANLDEKEIEKIKGLHLLTMKPVLYALNHISSGRHIRDEQPEKFDALIEYIKESNSKYIEADAGVEHELKDVHGDEQMEFRREFGVLESGVDAIIRASYDLLGLMTYFTTGDIETRGWTIKSGSTAPEAGAAIHTDFKDKFIRAQVVNWKDLIKSGSKATAREQGLIRTEGKEYIVQDGDVIEFMHS